MSIQELKTELMKLDLKGRAGLAYKLVQSLDELSGEENEQLWVEEALRRRKLLEEGKTN
jgi:hypothetical protein